MTLSPPQRGTSGSTADKPDGLWLLQARPGGALWVVLALSVFSVTGALRAQLLRAQKLYKITPGASVLHFHQGLREVGFRINTFGEVDGAAETANRDGSLRPASDCVR